MKWATSEMVHFDRVISAWLIARFVDKDATFSFLKPDEKPGNDVTPFGLPGVKLAAHDDDGTTVRRIIDTYALKDPALELLSKIVDDVVEHVMHDPDPTNLATKHPAVIGALWIAEGAMLMSQTDQECLDRSFPLYDYLYTRLEAECALKDQTPSPPATIFVQTVKLAIAGSVLRKEGSTWSHDGFANALRSVGPVTAHH